MEQNILITSVSTYSFKDEEGKLHEGGRFQYLTQEVSKKENVFGVNTAKQNLDFTTCQNISKSVPGIFKATFSMEVNSQGKNELLITSLAPLKKLDLNKIFSI